MKIVHLVNYYMPGMGYQENFLPFYQKKIGHEVAIVTSDRLYPFESQNSDFKGVNGARAVETGEYMDKGVHIFRVKTSYENIAHTLLKFSAKDLADRLYSLKPDVIHVHDYKNLNVFSAIEYSKQTGCRVFVDCHTDNRNNLAGRLIMRRLFFNSFTGLLYDYFIAKHVKFFLPITEASARFLTERLGIKAGQIRINRLGSDMKSLKYSEKKRKEVRGRLGYSESDIVFISTGKITRDKRYDIILDAFYQIELAHNNAKLLLIGTLEKDIEKQIKTMKNVKCIKFLPHAELAAYYSAADIALWPAPSISIIDSMICGLPFILYDELITKYLADSGGGLLFKTVLVAKENMEKFIKDEDLRKNLSDKAREYSFDNLSWENIAKQSVFIYNECIMEP